MTPTFGLLYRLLGFGRSLRKINVTDQDKASLMGIEGTVLYAMPIRSQIDHLAVNTAFNNHDVPLSDFAVGIHTDRWRPVFEGFARWVLRLRARTPSALTSTWWPQFLRSSGRGSVFLDAHPGWLDRWFSSQPDPFELALKEASDHPITVVPVIVIWQRSPNSRNPIREFFLAATPRRSWLRRWWDVYWRGNEAVLRIGEPIRLH